MPLIARVAVEKTAYHFDKLFSYLVPDALTNTLCRGMRVLVPFGAGNQKREGMVFDIVQQDVLDISYKPVLQALDETPLLPNDFFPIISFLKRRTFCTYYEAIRAMLPTGFHYNAVSVYRRAAGTKAAEELNDEEFALFRLLRTPKSLEMLQQSSDLTLPKLKQTLENLVHRGAVIEETNVKRKVGDETLRMVRLLPDFSEEKVRLSRQQKQMLQILQEVETASVKELCYLSGSTEAVLKNLIRHGAAEYYEREVYRTPAGNAAELTPLPILSDEQQQVFEELLGYYSSKTFETALLHGVTGSGKTQVFLRLIEKVVADGKQALMLVPEIALTPQMVQRFRSCFGDNIALLHSGLPLGERMDEWKRVRRGEVSIAIGTRSAVFAPFERLGLIVMDEEGESSYKSESSPRYHARDIARLRCKQNNVLLLLASATPSVDSYYRAESGAYHLLELEHRYTPSGLPKVTMLDMRKYALTDALYISPLLVEELQKNLAAGEQSMLLLNRRGYHTIARCADCGSVVECPHCSVALTYHSANRRMMCHYCGHSEPRPEHCPNCGSEHILLSGFGTQRLESELETYFSDARILRMDTDTTYSRYAYEEQFSRFAKGEYDIMVGTQMIAKGLDFPNVTLVGVLSIDQLLNGNDFMCGERAFSLLTQVIGRCGRGEKPGRAYVQTMTPDHSILKMAASQDYKAFYSDEISARRALLYPPFCDICTVGISGMREEAVVQAANRFVAVLRAAAEKLQEKLPMVVMGPHPAAVYRVYRQYRYRVVIKCKANDAFCRFMARVLNYCGRDKLFQNIRLYADLNGEN